MVENSLARPANGERADLRLGVVYGVALNHKAQRARLDASLYEPPYNGPPKSSVLYIKTPNTYRVGGGDVPTPAELTELQINATLAVQIGRKATRVKPSDALDYVSGYGVAIDVSEPEQGWFRPDVRQRCRDGFLPICGDFASAESIEDPAALSVVLELDGEVFSRWAIADLTRSVPDLIGEITDYMTLDEGDVLLAGLGPDRVLARKGQSTKASIAGVGVVTCTLTAEPSP